MTRTALALALLALGTGLAGLGVRIPAVRLVAAAVSGAGVTGWLVYNTRVEGRLLLEVAPGNGLVAADLLVVPAVVLVALSVVLDLRDQRG